MGALVSRAAAAMLGDASDEAELRRWMEEEDARRQAIQEEEEEEDYLCTRPLPSEEVRDGYSIWKARAALHRYNANHPGAEYDLVKPLMAACVIFRGNMWYHVSFLAHRRDQLVAPPVEYFFAELRDGCSDDDSIVEACTMIENPQSCSGNKCSFCPEQYQIAHPSEQELLCGKEEHVKDFIRLMNLSPMPFTCPTEPPEIGIVIEQ